MTGSKFISVVIFGLGIFYPVRVGAVDTVNFVHTDQLGSVSLVTDQTGEVVAQQSYYPYGNTRSYQLSVDSYQLGERQYTGQVSDQNQTGLYYYNARYYNPTLAKFTQADTVNDGLNRYAYVGNNPINKSDPSGNRYVESERLSTENNKKNNYLNDKFYFPQPGWNTCGPSVLTMIMVDYYHSKGVEADPWKIYQNVMNFYQFPTEGGDLLWKLKDYINNNDIELEAEFYQITRPNSAELFKDFIDKSGTLAAHVNTSYKDINAETGVEADHWVLVDDVKKINNQWYVLIRDPYRSSANDAKKRPLSGMIANPDGSIYVPWEMFQRSRSGYIMTVKSKKESYF